MPTTYTFTCPIEGCGVKLTSELPDKEAAANDLVQQATRHVAEVHPDIHKTPEQVNQDIRSLMVAQKE